MKVVVHSAVLNTMTQINGSSCSSGKPTDHREVPIGEPLSLADAPQLSLGERIQQGAALILIENLITPTERSILVDRCVEFADATEPTDFETPGRRRLPTIDAANRAAQTNTPCGTPLPDDVDEQLQTILARVTEYIDRELPSLVQVLFLGASDEPKGENENDNNSLTHLFQSDELQYSSREPAINVYRAGGDFDRHKDDQALTVLISLSCADQDYGGGGTAFWSQADSKAKALEPSLVVRPPAGTVILFGGCVTHAGRAVESGCRVVFVASFSPLEDPFVRY